MGLIVFFILEVLCLLKPKSRTVTAFLLVFMWALYAFNTVSGDGAIYQQVYEEQLHIYEPLFDLIMTLCFRLRLSFIGFRTVLATIFMALTFFSVKKYTPYTALALGLFLICPFGTLLSQIRAGLAAAVIVFGFRYIWEGTYTGKCKYLFCVFIAMLFHSSSVFYLIFLFVNTRYRGKSMIKSKLFLVVSFLSCFSCLGIILARQMLRENVIQMDLLKRLVSYLVNMPGKPNLNGMLTVLLALIGTLFVVVLARRMMLNRRSLEQQNLRVMTYVYSVGEVGVLLIVAVPFLFISSVFHRLLYEPLLLLICSATNAVYLLNKRNQSKKWLYKGMTVCWIVCFMLLEGLTYFGTDISFFGMFRFNKVFLFLDSLFSLR